MDKYLDNFTCPLGMDLFEDPITVPCCGQAMSRKPLTDWLNTQPEKTCALCTGDLSKFNPTTAQTNKNLLNLVEMVKKEKENKEKISGKKRNGNNINDNNDEPPKKRQKNGAQENTKQFHFKYIIFDNLITKQSNNIFKYDSRDRGNVNLFLEENISANALLSLWDLGGITTSCLNSLFWYKSNTFGKVFDYWEKTHLINKKNQLVYHYGQRQNRTWRPNRQIFKQIKGKRTKWPVEENDCIYRGKSQVFFLFDKRKVHKLRCNNKKKKEKKNNKEDDESKWENPNEKLLILKYFDILQQRLVLVDAIIAEKDCKLGDALHYFVDVVVANSEIGAMVKLRELLDKYDKKIQFCVFEEEMSFAEDEKTKFNFFEDCDLSNETIDDAQLINGDILVFCLNNKDETIKSEIESAIQSLKRRGESYQSNILEFCQYYHSHKKLEIEYSGVKSYKNTILPFINHLRTRKNTQSKEIKCSSRDIINLKIHNNHTFRDLRKQLSHLLGCHYICNLFFYAPIQSDDSQERKIVHDSEKILDYMKMESCKEVVPIKFDFQMLYMSEYKKLCFGEGRFGKISCQIARNDWGSPFIKPPKGIIEIVMDVEVPTFTIEVLDLLVNRRIKNSGFKLFTQKIDNSLQIYDEHQRGNNQDEKEDKFDENSYLPMVSSISCDVLKPEYFALITRNIRNDVPNGPPCIRQNREIGIVYSKDEMSRLIDDDKEDDAEIDNLYDVAKYFTKYLCFRVQMYYFEEIIAYELTLLRNDKAKQKGRDKGKKEESKQSMDQVNLICDMLKISNSNNIIDINRTKIGYQNDIYNVNYETIVKQEIKMANGANKILTHSLIPVWVYFLPNDGKSNFYQGHSLRILISSNESYFDILRLKIYPKLLMSNKENNGNGVNVSFDELMKDDNFYALQPFALSDIDIREDFPDSMVKIYNVKKSQWKTFNPYPTCLNAMRTRGKGRESPKGLLLVGIPNTFFANKPEVIVLT